MTESERSIFYQLCRSRRLGISPDGEAETRLLAYLADLSIDEKMAVFEAKKGLFRPMLIEAKKIADGDPFDTHLVDYACLIEAIQVHKTPSSFAHRKFDGPIPDLAQSFLDSRPKRGGKKAVLEPLLRIRHKARIMAWREQGHSFKAISEALRKEPGGTPVSPASLRRIINQWESQWSDEMIKNLESMEP